MKKPRQLRWVRMGVLTAAVAALLFVATGVLLWHVDSPDSEANCPICHFAHSRVLGSIPTAALLAPVVLAWILPAELQVTRVSPAAHDFSPRAPPV